MDPVSIAMMAAPLVELLVNAFGQSRADAEANAAKMVQQQAFDTTMGIEAPQLQLAELYEQGPAGISAFSEDARLKAAQMKALEGLGREVEYEGMTPEDRLAYQQAAAEAGSVEAGLRGAAQREAAQRGIGSSTGAYLGALSASQAGTNRASAMQSQAAADARQRYMQALSGLGGLGGQVRGQEFDIASARAAAQDAINRFNVGQRSATQQHNLGVPQQDFENALRRAQAQRQAAGQMAKEYRGAGRRAQQTAAKWGAAGKRWTEGFASSFGGGGE